MKNKQRSSSAVIGPDIRTSAKRQSRLNQLFSILPFFSSKPKIAVLRLEGVIGKAGAFKSGLTLDSMNKLIEKMFKIECLEAICLSINSPGGAPVQAELITNRIIALAKEKDIPVFSFVEDVAASGGYWLALAGDKIYVSRSSVVGSIGVISSGFGFHEAIAKLGIERRVYTEGKTKSVLDPFKPEKSADIKIIKKIQKEIHEHFVAMVKKRRSSRLTQNDDILFNGEFWSGQTAVDYGLVDGIDNLYTFIQKNYGRDVEIVYIENKQSWIKKKIAASKAAQDFAQDFAEGLVTSAENRLLASKFDLK